MATQRHFLILNLFTMNGRCQTCQMQEDKDFLGEKVKERHFLNGHFLIASLRADLVVAGISSPSMRKQELSIGRQPTAIYGVIRAVGKGNIRKKMTAKNSE